MEFDLDDVIGTFSYIHSTRLLTDAARDGADVIKIAERITSTYPEKLNENAARLDKAQKRAKIHPKKPIKGFRRPNSFLEVVKHEYTNLCPVFYVKDFNATGGSELASANEVWSQDRYIMISSHLLSNEWNNSRNRIYDHVLKYIFDGILNKDRDTLPMKLSAFTYDGSIFTNPNLSTEEDIIDINILIEDSIAKKNINRRLERMLEAYHAIENFNHRDLCECHSSGILRKDLAFMISELGAPGFNIFANKVINYVQDFGYKELYKK
jgi:hypothetical protein